MAVETLDDYFSNRTEWDFVVTPGIYRNSGGPLNGYDAGNPAAAGVHQITDPARQVELL